MYSSISKYRSRYVRFINLNEIWWSRCVTKYPTLERLPRVRSAQVEKTSVSIYGIGVVLVKNVFQFGADEAVALRYDISRLRTRQILLFLFNFRTTTTPPSLNFITQYSYDTRVICASCARWASYAKCASCASNGALDPNTCRSVLPHTS